jgi:DNA polymerase (family 10)
MAEAARALGYEYLALCDHSQSLKVAGGLSVAELRKKHREIDALNRTFRGFRILKGAEVDILADGSLDYPDDILDELEIVVVSVHTLFGLDKAAQTKRVIAALRHPRVTLLAHPTGRMLGQRDPYPINLHEVIKAAAEHGKALELNAQPDRLDISGSALREAKAAGVMISIDSDAHDTKSLSYVPRFGAGVARRGWLESKDVLNALPLAKLLKKLANASPGA